MSSNEYPEHLNPFSDETTKSKTKLSLRNSFSRLTKPLRQSFRRILKDGNHPSNHSKSNDVTLRRKNADDSFPRYSQSTQNMGGTPALPRSRFHDRVSQNPFEDQDDANLDIDSLQRNTIRRRTKKRAPLPPNKSLSNDHLNNPNYPRASHWSLTSVETDYSTSSDYYNNHEGEQELIEEKLPIDHIREITKGLEQLISDSTKDRSSAVIDEKRKSNDIPDIVVSCASNTLNESLTNVTSDIQNVGDGEEAENHEDDGSVKDENDEEDDGLVVRDITHNLMQEENDKSETAVSNTIVDEDNVNNNNGDEEKFNYNQSKSIYINGSKDDLNDRSSTYCEKKDIFITNSCETINDKNNNNNQEDCGSNTDDSANDAPIPKLRKHKLSKTELLGA